MHALTAYESETVFTKTAKGLEEMTQRRFGLNMRQRRVLIVVDGIKNLDAIKEIMLQDNVDEIIAYLVEEHFVAPLKSSRQEIQKRQPGKSQARTTRQADANAPHERSAGTAASAPPVYDQEKIRQVKDFMTTTATTYLGLLSADVIRRIEHAKGIDQLMSAVGYWHMALRESKQGSRFAGSYLNQVTAALSVKSR